MASSRIGAAAVIFSQRGRVLLVKHTYGRRNWEIPGGYGEPGESAADTACREVREETGLEIAVERLTGIYYDPEEDMHHFAFLCHAKGSQRPQPDSSEISQSDYFALDRLPRPMNDFTHLRIRDAARDARVGVHTIATRQWLGE